MLALERIAKTAMAVAGTVPCRVAAQGIELLCYTSVWMLEVEILFRVFSSGFRNQTWQTQV